MHVLTITIQSTDNPLCVSSQVRTSEMATEVFVAGAIVAARQAIDMVVSRCDAASGGSLSALIDQIHADFRGDPESRCERFGEGIEHVDN